MAAFAAAVELGYTHLETDVHLSSDGVVIAFHDPFLDRVTNSSGPVESLPLRHILEADAGYGFTSDGGLTFPYRGTGLKVPALEEILTSWPHVLVNIDMKTDATVAPIAALIARLHAEDRVCVGSFSDRRLLRFRTLTRGAVCTSMGIAAVTQAWLTARTGRMRRYGADVVQMPPSYRRVRVADARFLEAAHRAGLPVHVWTIDDKEIMRALLDSGVDGIMTDRPTVLREVLVSRGEWHGATQLAGTAERQPHN